MAPNNEYLLLLDHPAIKIAITEIEATEEIYNTPILISQIWKFLANAIGAIISMAAIIIINGAKLNKKRSAPSGVKPSFNMSFKVSAEVCNQPLGPTLLGPKRICITADTLRSINTNSNPSTANNAITNIPSKIFSATKAKVPPICNCNQL